ncbi:hypothetical protein [Burkholderia sp. SG-MS1]|uniref:hypothetical protein n=1 Tax=Paraburkholderia sp. SG-MS1 TaxID=2023741 RepID=UPI00158078B7
MPQTVEEIGAHGCINFRTASGRIVDLGFKVGGVSRKVAHTAQHTSTMPISLRKPCSMAMASHSSRPTR